MKSNPNSKVTLALTVAALGAAPLTFSCNPDPLNDFSTVYQHSSLHLPGITESPKLSGITESPKLSGITESPKLAPMTESSDHLEKIIGDNDLTPVSENGANLPDSLRPLLDAFGQVSIGCSATHVGDGLVLTAGHCLLTSPRTGPKNCRGTSVVWGNYAGHKTQTISKCREILFRSYTAASDIALIRVDNPPVVAIPLDLKTSSASVLLPRNKITMLSFPRMRPLEWSRECELSEYRPPAAPEDMRNSQETVKKFLHSCDTEPGSSGAALIDTTTLKIIGVHGGSSDELNYGTFLDDIQLQLNIIQML
jgi:hypothetical protein